MSRQYIYRDFRVERGDILRQSSLSGCWVVRIDNEEINIPKYAVFNTKKECIDEIEIDIELLQRLIKRLGD